MLVIEVEFLHGTLRAASPDNTTWAQGEPLGEWPPSPARVFSALVAGGGTRARWNLSSGEELSWLERLPPPKICGSAPADVEVSSLVPRYAVIDRTSDAGAVQNYPARSAIAVAPGVRLSPKSSLICYVWPDAQPTPEVLDTLGARAARVGYLGCADSPVRMSVGRTSDRADSDSWEPEPGGEVSLPIPYPGFTENLDASFDRWSAMEDAGERSWIRTVRCEYRPPGRPPGRGADYPIPIALWLRVEPALSGKRLVAFTSALRAAVTDHMQRLLPGAEVPSVIHGHRGPADSEVQACFLGLPNVGNEYSDGRLLGAAVLLPHSSSPEIVQLVRSALYGLRRQRLVKPGWFDLAVNLYAGEKKPFSAHPNRWSRAATRWVSASPVVFERWTKGVPGLSEVSRWCDHAGLPTPVAAGFQRMPLIRGGLDLHPDDVARPGRERRPYSHMWVEFEKPVRGPVLIGRGRYLGLGLMVPVPGQTVSTGD